MIGDAIKIELYVPTMMPMEKAKAKPWIPDPPIMYSTTVTINVVNDVSRVRLKV